jgi:hypothetical protein
MARKKIVSVYEVTDYKTGKMERVFIEGDGQEGAKFIMSEYPRFTKFILEGFEIDGTFVELKTRR